MEDIFIFAIIISIIRLKIITFIEYDGTSWVKPLIVMVIVMKEINVYQI